jgi:cytochrome P450 family 6
MREFDQKKFQSLIQIHSIKSQKMIVNYLLVFLGTIIVYLYFKLKKKIHYFEDRGIHSNDWKFPLGDLAGVGSKIHFVDAVKNVYESFKDTDSVCGFYNLITPVIIPTDLDAIKDILIKDFNTFVDRGVYYNEETDPLLVTLYGFVNYQILNNI